VGHLAFPSIHLSIFTKKRGARQNGSGLVIIQVRDP
jgi:hypothetical protein